MTATTATDDSGFVEYNFQCVAGGGGCVDSGWQSSSSHTATGLDADTSYSFRVLARDGSGNTTAASSTESATTDEAPPPPDYVDHLAESETAVEGTVSGNYLATHADDGSAQSITEIAAGSWFFGTYQLEHVWHFSVSPGNPVTLVANAWSGDSGEGFVFAYSLDGTNYTDMFNVTSTASGNEQSYVLPGSTSGPVWVRVRDLNRTTRDRSGSTLNVDQLYIRSEN